MPEEANPFKIAQQQLDNVAGRLKLKKGIHQFLRTPRREFTVNFPVRMGHAAKTDRPMLRAIDVFLRNRSFLYRKSRGLVIDLIGYHYPLETHADFRPYKKDYNDEDNRRMDLTLKIISKVVLLHVFLLMIILTVRLKSMNRQGMTKLKID